MTSSATGTRAKEGRTGERVDVRVAERVGEDLVDEAVVVGDEEGVAGVAASVRPSQPDVAELAGERNEDALPKDHVLVVLRVAEHAEQLLDERLDLGRRQRRVVLRAMRYEGQLGTASESQGGGEREERTSIGRPRAPTRGLSPESVLLATDRRRAASSEPLPLCDAWACW